VSRPALSIAIPFFNEEQALPLAIRSVFAQTHTDWELLLVDDGSTDRSLQVAASVVDPRVRVLRSSHRRGLSHSLNLVAEEARGSFIGRMDADDVMHPTRLERELQMLEQEPGLSAVGTWVAYAHAPKDLITVGEISPPSSRAEALRRGVLAHATVLARREFFLENPYDAAFDRAEDRELFFRTFVEGRFAAIPEPLYVILPRPHRATFVENYRETCRQNRALFRRFGPEVWGGSRTAARIAGSLAREALYVMASAAGQPHRLVQRRGRTPSSWEDELARQAISVSSGTVVPGLAHSP
jgi:glycosyltransferase involved in cell wall biosynthesis